MQVEPSTRFANRALDSGERFLRRRSLYPAELRMQFLSRFRLKPPIRYYRRNWDKSQSNSGNMEKRLLLLVAQGDAHGAGGADLVAVARDKLGLAGDGGERVVRDDVVRHADRLAVLLARDELRGMHAEVG